MQRNGLELNRLSLESTLKQWVRAGFEEITENKSGPQLQAVLGKLKNICKAKKLKKICDSEKFDDTLFTELDNATYPLTDIFIDPFKKVLLSYTTRVAGEEKSSYIFRPEHEAETSYLAKVELAKLIIKKMKEENCVDRAWIYEVKQSLKEDFDKIKPFKVSSNYAKIWNIFLDFLVFVTFGIMGHTLIDSYQKKGMNKNGVLVPWMIFVTICLTYKQLKLEGTVIQNLSIAKSPDSFEEFKINEEKNPATPRKRVSLGRNPLSFLKKITHPSMLFFLVGVVASYYSQDTASQAISRLGAAPKARGMAGVEAYEAHKKEREAHENDSRAILRSLIWKEYDRSSPSLPSGKNYGKNDQSESFLKLARQCYKKENYSECAKNYEKAAVEKAKVESGNSRRHMYSQAHDVLLSSYDFEIYNHCRAQTGRKP